MSPLLSIARRIWTGQRAAWLRGLGLSATVLAAGIALLGLSGWFVTAAGAAGLAGLGIAFDFFRPSAGVRILALGRAAARYGERVLTHEATLASLADLRRDLLARMTRFPFDEMLRVRGGQALNRITADVDALDGLPLRLIVPLFAGGVAVALTLAGLGLLVDWWLAAGVVAFYLAGVGAVLANVALRSRAHARRAEVHFQAMRSGIVDMLRGQADLLAAGALEDHRRRVLRADRRARAAEAALERIDRRSGFALQAVATIAAAGAFAGGAYLAEAGKIGAAQVALAFFAALAMAEAGALLRRGLADLGRMADAARRICGILDGGSGPVQAADESPDAAGGIRIRDLAFSRSGRVLFDGVDLDVAPGETVALTGRSGAGKSTLLNIAAGLVVPARGEVVIRGRPLADWPEAGLRAQVALLPQRSALMSGTLREALALAQPGITDAEALTILDAVALGELADRFGGLDGRLGEGGAGLSGGEKRRLALARVLARHPAILLLDEPTEGLDPAMARCVLHGIRKILSESVIIVAAHRPAEQEWADRVVALNRGQAEKMHP